MRTSLLSYIAIYFSCMLKQIYMFDYKQCLLTCVNANVCTCVYLSIVLAMRNKRYPSVQSPTNLFIYLVTMSHMSPLIHVHWNCGRPNHVCGACYVISIFFTTWAIFVVCVFIQPVACLYLSNKITVGFIILCKLHQPWFSLSLKIVYCFIFIEHKRCWVSIIIITWFAKKLHSALLFKLALDPKGILFCGHLQTLYISETY